MQNRKFKISVCLILIILSSALIVAVSFNGIKREVITIPDTTGVYDDYLKVADNIPDNTGELDKKEEKTTQTSTELNPTKTTIVILLTTIITAVILYLILTKGAKLNLFMFKENVIIYIISLILCSTILSIINIGIINNLNYIEAENTELEINANHHVFNSKENFIDETLESNNDSKSVLILDSSSASLVNSVVNKSGDSNSLVLSLTEGLNSALIISASNLKMDNTELTTDGVSAHGIFGHQKNTNIDINNSKLLTLKDNSYGLLLRPEATAKVSNSTITTTLRESHGIFINKAKIDIENSNVNTLNENSYALYINGDATVIDSIISANKSDAIFIENSGILKIENSEITTDKITILRSNEITSELPATLTINGGKIISKNILFDIFNNKTIINLSNVKINPSEVLLKTSKKEDNKTNLPGSTIELNGNNQTLVGDIIIDSISSLSINLRSSSKLKSGINSDHIAKNISLNLSADSTITLTNDAYIHSFINEDKKFTNINDNGFNIYYDKKDLDNDYLNGEVYELKNGGKLMPI